MPTLTRKAKRRHFESEEEGNSSDNEGEGGILAQRAARWLAAQIAHDEAQQQAPREEPAREEPQHQPAARQQPQQQQVCRSVFLLVSL